MTFDISESEQTLSPLVNDTIPEKEAITEKEIAVTEDKATQTLFRRMSAAEVSQEEENSKENVGESVVDVEPEDLVNENKSEQEEDNKKERLLEKDIEETDVAQGGQEEDIVVAEHAQEELKTNGGAERWQISLLKKISWKMKRQMQKKVGLTQSQRCQKNIWRMTNKTEIRSKNLKNNILSLWNLKVIQAKILKHLQGLKSLKRRNGTQHSWCQSGAWRTIMEETMSFIPEEDVDPVLSENVKCSTTKELNAGVIKSDVLNILGPVESEVTAFCDKEQSKVKARRYLTHRSST